MEKVVVQTGAKTYQITDQDGNDLGVFRFIPSDAGILRNESMISVMDVLVIFLSGFISAKVCDYVHELEREENEA